MAYWPLQHGRQVRHQAGQLRPWTSRVPSTFAFCLCFGAAFLAGVWVSRFPGKGTSPAEAANVLQPEALAEAFLQHSGLLQHRPPLQPAGSGNAEYTIAPYQILSWYPRIVVFPDFIDADRAQHIIDLAEQQLRPSTVPAKGGGSAQTEQIQGRTSSGAFLSRDDDPEGVLAWLERRIQDVTLLPSSHGEKFYVIRYLEGERYNPHLDPHDPAEYGPQSSSRMATAVVYLNDVVNGGETIFPREGADGAEKPVGPASCDMGTGLKYKPRRGDALLFYSLDPDQTLNPRAVHGGCAVGKGSEKWVVTKWIRNKPVRREGPRFGWG